MNGGRQLIDVVRVVLQELGFHVEGNRKRLVLLRAQCLAQEIDRRFLLKVQALANAVAGIDKNPDAKGQIGLTAEESDFLRLPVLQETKIFLCKVNDHPVLLVKDCKRDIDQVYRNTNCAADPGLWAGLRAGNRLRVRLPICWRRRL